MNDSALHATPFAGLHFFPARSKDPQVRRALDGRALKAFHVVITESLASTLEQCLAGIPSPHGVARVSRGHGRYKKRPKEKKSDRMDLVASDLGSSEDYRLRLHIQVCSQTGCVS